MNTTRFALKRMLAIALAILAAADMGYSAPNEPASTKGPPVIVDIRDFGAVGDGKTSCTAAIQKAIDECAARGGGTVRLPAGIWLTGTVYLESHLTLVLDKGCTLLGSRKHEDYARPRPPTRSDARLGRFRYAAILAGADIQNVTIRGEGTIDGQGDAFRDKSKPRPKNLYLQNCRGVVIEGIRLRNAGSWMQHRPESTMFGTLPAYGLYCRHVEGLTLRNVQLRTTKPDLRHAVLADDVERLRIDALTADCAKGAASVLRLVQVEDAEIRHCKAPAAADPFLLLEGNRTRRIVLEQNDFGAAAKQVDFRDGASAQAVLRH